MTLLTLRVRTNVRTVRVQIDDGVNVASFRQAVAKELAVPPNSVKLSLTPAVSAEELRC